LLPKQFPAKSTTEIVYFRKSAKTREEIREELEENERFFAQLQTYVLAETSSDEKRNQKSSQESLKTSEG
jgi:hypothetical protein